MTYIIRRTSCCTSYDVRHVKRRQIVLKILSTKKKAKVFFFVLKILSNCAENPLNEEESESFRLNLLAYWYKTTNTDTIYSLYWCKSTNSDTERLLLLLLLLLLLVVLFLSSSFFSFET